MNGHASIASALALFLRQSLHRARGGSRRVWTAEEQDLLRRYYPGTPTEEIARALGCTPEQVGRQARQLGLRKTTETVALIARERSLRTGRGSQATRFKPGFVPANKGLRRPGFAPGRMGATQFKPGSKPHTTLPVGSFRVVEGRLERKFSEEKGGPHKRWAFYGHLLWEQAHGPVPPGHLVVFKPGRATVVPELLTLDALECITRAENMARNSIHNMHPKLADISRLRGRINRAIHRREKGQP